MNLYPLNAMKVDLSIRLNPFIIWWLPTWHYHKNLSESAKADGETIWYIRWLYFQISFCRWV